MSLLFDLPKEQSSILKVIGVGGGGSNAVNHMLEHGIEGVDFIVCNTDQQALDISPVPIKIQIGSTLTEGRGAGSIPEVGKNAAIENIEDVKAVLARGTTMLFITAGMGGGTGTGAAPVIAQTAKEMGILTVAIVTIPFGFEGPRRRKVAEAGLENLRKTVDTLLVIKNDKMREVYGNLSVAEAFAKSDNILATAAKGIAEVISTIGYINVDMNDVNTVMKDSGAAIMGSATAEGEHRATKAVKEALESPLLNDNEIRGAKHVLLNIKYGDIDVTMDELDEITTFIQSEAGDTAEVIMGYGKDESLAGNISITVIATGFNSKQPTTAYEDEIHPEKTYRDLDEDIPLMITNPIEIEKPLKSPTKNTLTFEKDGKIEEEMPEPFLKVPEENAKRDESDENKSKELTFDFGSFGDDSNEIEMNDFEEAEMDKKYYNLEEEEGELEEDTIEELPVEKQVKGKIASISKISQEEQQQRVSDRMTRIKELSQKFKTPSGLADLENEPAYRRKKIKLEDVPHSSESQISRYSLKDESSESGEKFTGIKKNPFLHDNVD